MDSDRLHEFEQVLTEEGLPANVEEINSSDDSPPIATEVQFFNVCKNLLF
jgi:hypothetical protein